MYKGSAQAEMDKSILRALELHHHPTSNATKWGMQLLAGEIVREDDYIGSPDDDDWVFAGMVYAGDTIRQGCCLLWVRPCSVM